MTDDTTVIEVGDYTVELTTGHEIRINQPLTRDELVRVERALTEIGDPDARTVDRIDLHPINGEIADATVHTRPCLRPGAACTCQATDCPIVTRTVRA